MVIARWMEGCGLCRFGCAGRGGGTARANAQRTLVTWEGGGARPCCNQPIRPVGQPGRHPAEDSHEVAVVEAVGGGGRLVSVHGHKAKAAGAAGLALCMSWIEWGDTVQGFSSGHYGAPLRADLCQQSGTQHTCTPNAAETDRTRAPVAMKVSSTLPYLLNSWKRSSWWYKREERMGKGRQITSWRHWGESPRASMHATANYTSCTTTAMNDLHPCSPGWSTLQTSTGG